MQIMVNFAADTDFYLVIHLCDSLKLKDLYQR